MEEEKAPAAPRGKGDREEGGRFHLLSDILPFSVRLSQGSLVRYAAAT